MGFCILQARELKAEGPDLRHVLLLLFLVGMAHHLVDTQVRMGTVAEGDAT